MARRKRTRGLHLRAIKAGEDRWQSRGKEEVEALRRVRAGLITVEGARRMLRLPPLPHAGDA